MAQQIALGEIVDNAAELKEALKEAYEANPDKQVNAEPIGETE